MNTWFPATYNEGAAVPAKTANNGVVSVTYIYGPQSVTPLSCGILPGPPDVLVTYTLAVPSSGKKAGFPSRIDVSGGYNISELQHALTMRVHKS